MTEKLYSRELNHTHDGIFCWRCRHDLASVPCKAIIFAKSKDAHDFIIECIPGYLLGTLILKIVPVQVLELMVCAMLVCFIIMRYRSGASSYRLPESSAIGIGTGVVSGYQSRVSRFTGPGGTLSYRYTFGIKPSPHTMRGGDS